MARFQSVKQGESINLTKVNNDIPLKKIHVGLGWDINSDVDADLDAFVVQLDSNNLLMDTIYFGHLASNDGAIKHMGDNLTGEGEGDDEVVYIDLDGLDQDTRKLIVAVNIYQCRLTFEQIKNAFVRIVNRDNEEMLIRYDLSTEFGPNYSMVVGEIYKNEDGSWDFKAVGKATTDKNIREVETNLSSGKAQSKNTGRKKMFGIF